VRPEPALPERLSVCFLADIAPPGKNAQKRTLWGRSRRPLRIRNDEIGSKTPGRSIVNNGRHEESRSC